MKPYQIWLWRFQGSLRVASILLYFISFKAWVENLHIKNCIKILMVVMPSYFYREYKDKPWNPTSSQINFLPSSYSEKMRWGRDCWKSSVKKTILITSQTYKTAQQCFTVVYGVEPKWISNIKFEFENLKSKFKNWNKIEI